MGQTNAKPKQPTFFRLLLAQMAHHKATVAAMSFGNTVVGILSGALMAEAFRQILQAILATSSAELVNALLFLVFLILLNGVCSVAYEKGTFALEKDVTYYCENEIYNVFWRQEYWTNQEQVMGQIRENVPSTVSGMVSQINSIYQTIVILIAGSVYAGSLNYEVLLLCVLVIGIFLAISHRAIRKLGDCYSNLARANSEKYSRLWEQVLNREVARFLVPERVEKPYMDKVKEYLDALLKVKKIGNATDLFSRFGSTFMIIIIAAVGGSAVIRGQMNITVLAALVIVIPNISAYLFAIPEIIAQWRGVVGQSEPIMELLESKGEVAAKARTKARQEETKIESEKSRMRAEVREENHREKRKDVKRAERKGRHADREKCSDRNDEGREQRSEGYESRREPGREEMPDNEVVDIRTISLDGLTFAYQEDTPVLKGISLELNSGFYCLAGTSGCGKTTLVKILAKLLPCQGGTIRIDGKDLREIGRESYWKQICLVSQSSVILHDTLLYNIIMSEGEYDEDRVWAAIRGAQLEDYVKAQPDGIRTVISSKTISKGEGQKINLTRALYTITSRISGLISRPTVRP
ncbi:MAG: ATP-binding cassette domain-containing protein, partial [Lachnospiraceae bacterium]|nr:ATP-binding cassette domain-containing protein [Lachnospiraceae bacterium]